SSIHKESVDSSDDDAVAVLSIFYIHLRDAEAVEMLFVPALYREVVERIRESDTDVIINLTASGGGDWTPSEENPANGGPGTIIQTPEERHQSVGELLPEICTLDAGSLNFGDMVYINPENWIRKHAEIGR